MREAAPNPANTSEEAVTIRCSDGLEIAGRLVLPAESPRGALLLSGATGVRKEFYARFARGAAARGYACLTYDYRGIGGSRPRSLRGFNATMRDWGQLDMNAAWTWLLDRFSGAPSFILGHSVGSQLVALMDGVERARGIAMIASSTGSWHTMSPGYVAYSWVMWYGFVPASTALLGYAPFKALRLGEDLPAGVAREWGAWCKRRDYFAGTFDAATMARFKEVKTPILAISFSDDPIGTPGNVRALLGLYDSAPVEHLEGLRPRDFGRKSIGHMGFFSSQNERTLWPKAFDWFDVRVAGGDTVGRDAGKRM